MHTRLLAFAFVMAASVAAQAQAQEKWVVGQSAPLTGGNAAFGNDIRDGALAWFKAVNERGGVQGRPIELVSLDDKNDRKVAGANAKQLIDQQKDLLALFGFASATLSLDAIPHAEAKQVPFFAPFSGANPVRTNNPVLFTIRASYGEEMEKMLVFWTKVGYKQVSVVHYDDEVGRENLKVVADWLAKINLQPKALPLKRNAPVTKEQVDALVAQQPQFVVSTVLSGAAAAIQKELVQRGRVLPTSSLSFVGADQYIKAAGPAGSGVSIAQVVPSPSSTIPAVRDCAKAIEAHTGKPTVNTTQLEACFAAKVLVEGIRRARKPVNAQSVLESLANLGTYDLGGYRITFAPGAQHGSKYVDLAMVTRDGRLTTQ